jgi:hypothetical protein
MPSYTFDDTLRVDRECDIPPAALFIELGWDEDAQTKRKHYRRFYNRELEKEKSVLPKESPFNQYDLKKGQTRGGKKSLFSLGDGKQDASGQVDTTKVTGRFKAIINIQLKNEKATYAEKKLRLFNEMVGYLAELAKYREITDFDLDLSRLETFEGRQELRKKIEPLGVGHLKIVRRLADINSDIILQHLLLTVTPKVVRVYMISGFNFASRDVGFSDPYLILQLGAKVISEKQNY